MAAHDDDEGDMTGRSQNDRWVDEELRAALAVDPSPDFTARVRTRIDREQVRDARQAWIFATGMLAASAVLAIATSVMWRANPPLDPSVLPSVTEAGLLNTSPLDAPAAGSPGLTIEPRVTTTPVRFANPRFRGFREPEVLMPRDERLGIQRLIEFARRRDDMSVGLMTSMSDGDGSAPVASGADVAPESAPATSVTPPEAAATGDAGEQPAGGVNDDAGALVIKPLTIKPLDNEPN
jgi:hypothetical protein